MSSNFKTVRAANELHTNVDFISKAKRTKERNIDQKMQRDKE